MFTFFVQVGKSAQHIQIFKDTLDTFSEDLSNHISFYQEYAFVENIEEDVDSDSLKMALNLIGVVIWLIMENKDHGQNVIFERKTRRARGTISTKKS